MYARLAQDTTEPWRPRLRSQSVLFKESPRPGSRNTPPTLSPKTTLSYPCLTNQQVYPTTQAGELLAQDTPIKQLETLSECETYRWDVIFTSSVNRLDRVSLTTDGSGERHINLLSGDHMLRWQIVTPHDDPRHAEKSPFTWNTHIYFSSSAHTTYVQSYQLK